MHVQGIMVLECFIRIGYEFTSWILPVRNMGQCWYHTFPVLCWACSFPSAQQTCRSFSG